MRSLGRTLPRLWACTRRCSPPPPGSSSRAGRPSVSGAWRRSSDRVVWASGNQGTCVRTTDGGATWRRSARRWRWRSTSATSRPSTATGPSSWRSAPARRRGSSRRRQRGTALVECYRNRDPKGFLDAIAFWDHDHGLALGDPVDGRFVILATDDAGRIWTSSPTPGPCPPPCPARGPSPRAGPAWSSAPGTSLVRHRRRGRRRASSARSTAGGAGPSPRPRSGPPSRRAGSSAWPLAATTWALAVGGDYKSIADPAANLAITSDGGGPWTAGPDSGRPGGFRSAVSFLPGRPDRACSRSARAGLTCSDDGGRTWRTARGGADGWHALAVAPSGRFAWVVGEGGRIARMTVADVVKAR